MALVRTTAQLIDRLAKLEAALDAVLVNKTYQFEGMTLTRAREDWITAQIEIIEGRLSRRTYGNRLDVEILR